MYDKIHYKLKKKNCGSIKAAGGSEIVTATLGNHLAVSYKSKHATTI